MMPTYPTSDGRSPLTWRIKGVRTRQSERGGLIRTLIQVNASRNSMRVVQDVKALPRQLRAGFRHDGYSSFVQRARHQDAVPFRRDDIARAEAELRRLEEQAILKT